MEPGSAEYVIVFSFGIMVLILLTLCGNVLVCVAVFMSRSLRHKINYMIVSLAVADIMIACVCMPLWLVFEVTGFQSFSVNALVRIIKVSTFFDILGAIASISNLTAISYERLYSVCAPLKHRRFLTPKTVCFVLLFVWSYALLVAATNILWWEWPWLTVYTAILGFFIPLLLIVLAYVLIFVTVLRSPRNVISKQDNLKISKTICVIIGLFVLSWAPFFIASILSTYCLTCHIYIANNLWLRSTIKWLHYANSCVNPVVYGIANAQYKEAFKTVFRKLTTKCFPCLPERETTERAIPLQSRVRTQTQLFHPRLQSCETEIIKVEKENSNSFDDHLQYPQGDYRAIPRFLQGAAARPAVWAPGCYSDSAENLMTVALFEGYDDSHQYNVEALRRTSDV